MSVKIHDGLRVDLAPYGGDLFAFVDVVRARATAVLLDLQAEELARRATAVIDDRLISDAHEDAASARSPLSLANDRWQEAQGIPGLFVRGEDPFSFELQLFGCGEHVLGVPFFERKEYLKVLQQIDGVDDYGYWDNADPPDNVSEEEWEQRKADWSRGNGPDFVPACHGVSVDLGVSSSDLLMPWRLEHLGYRGFRSKVLAAQPSVEGRARRIAKRWIQNRLDRDTADASAGAESVTASDIAVAVNHADVSALVSVEPLTEERLIRWPENGAGQDQVNRAGLEEIAVSLAAGRAVAGPSGC